MLQQHIRVQQDSTAQLNKRSARYISKSRAHQHSSTAAQQGSRQQSTTLRQETSAQQGAAVQQCTAIQHTSAAQWHRSRKHVQHSRHCTSAAACYDGDSNTFSEAPSLRTSVPVPPKSRQPCRVFRRKTQPVKLTATASFTQSNTGC